MYDSSKSDAKPTNGDATNTLVVKFDNTVTLPVDNYKVSVYATFNNDAIDTTAVNGAKAFQAVAFNPKNDWINVVAAVPAQDAECTAVADGTHLTIGNTYYTSTACAGELVSDGTEVADGSNYFTMTTPATPATSQSVNTLNTDNAK